MDEEVEPDASLGTSVVSRAGVSSFAAAAVVACAGMGGLAFFVGCGCWNSSKESASVEVSGILATDSVRANRACLFGGTTTTGAGALAWLFFELERFLDDFDIVSVDFNLQGKSYHNSFLVTFTHSKNTNRNKIWTIFNFLNCLNRKNVENWFEN